MRFAANVTGRLGRMNDGEELPGKERDRRDAIARVTFIFFAAVKVFHRLSLPGLVIVV